VPVIVVGSANIDQVFRVERIPAPGETVLSNGFSTALGGKGQNQAVAAARAGAPTRFVAALGDDAFGAQIRAGLESDGISGELLREVDAPTGTALIAVDAHGENTIIVEAGANAQLLGLSEADRAAIAESAVLVMQLEIPLETVVAAALHARANGTTAVLNAAPIRDLPDELLASIDILVVNEHEAAHLAASRPGIDLTDLVPTVIVTLGADGAVLYGQGAAEIPVPAPRVTAVDATGAGDTFCGALAAAIDEGQQLDAALRFAVVAASLSVEHHGAVPSIPHRAAIDERLVN
jgi:ribokinase